MGGDLTNFFAKIQMSGMFPWAVGGWTPLELTVTGVLFYSGQLCYLEKGKICISFMYVFFLCMLQISSM